MSEPIDIYEDRIRFRGYDAPLDLSALPPTVRDELVSQLQERADEYWDGIAAEIARDVYAAIEVRLDQVEIKVRDLKDARKGAPPDVQSIIKELADAVAHLRRAYEGSISQYLD